MAVLKVIVDFMTLLICAEGTRLLENAIAFSSCVGKFNDANQCPAGLAGQGETPQALKRRGGSPTARGKRSAWSTNQQTCLTKPYN
jgi:hypothetical protein